MIAKRVMSPKGGAGFRRLGAYVLNAKGNADPASWTRLNSYVLDTEHAGEKVAWARVTNCGTSDPGWAVKRIIATQARNTRAKADRSYHLVVSFPRGEKPTRAQMEDIEDRLCEAIGFGDHQRVSAVHQNTDHWHLHVAINRVHPVTHHAVHPFRDHYRLQDGCAELEIKHGLTREVHSRDAHEAACNDTRRREGRPGRGQEPTHEAFRKARAEALRARDAAVKALRVQHAEYARRLSDWHSERLRQEGALALHGHLRRDGFAHLAEQRRKDRAERLAREAEERHAVLAAHPIPTWAEFVGAAGTQPPTVPERDKSAGRDRSRAASYKPTYKQPEEQQR